MTDFDLAQFYRLATVGCCILDQHDPPSTTEQNWLPPPEGWHLLAPRA